MFVLYSYIEKNPIVFSSIVHLEPILIFFGCPVEYTTNMNKCKL